ncbi:hypothetical protein H8356DRAFT_1335994 [Neocallimastix lanati (nom. inval.)]|nr:hypothetical protein H8356DRAFT_1335994 [Neocallimastix sp. JGI-2020a]
MKVKLYKLIVLLLITILNYHCLSAYFVPLAESFHSNNNTKISFQSKNSNEFINYNNINKRLKNNNKRNNNYDNNNIKIINNFFDNDIVSISNTIPFNELFYNQLNDEQKIVYDTLLSTCQDQDNLISPIVQLTHSNCDNRSYGASVFCQDNSTFIIKYTLVNEYSPEINLSKNTIITRNEEIQAVIQNIKRKISQKGLTTIYDVLKFIHDYLVTNIVYTPDMDNPDKYYYIRTIYGALVKQDCVCEGYAEAFKVLANEYGINTITPVSATHKWNFAQIGNQWYVVDITHDDPLLINQYGEKIYTPLGDKSNLRYNFFLIGNEDKVTSTMICKNEESHILVYSTYTNTNRVIEYPVLSDTAYDPTNKSSSLLSDQYICKKSNENFTGCK